MDKKKEHSKTPNYDKLSVKEKLFINAYIRHGLNQTQAFLECFPRNKYESARTEAAKLLAKPNLRVAANEKIKEFIEDKENLTKDLFETLYRIAKSKISDIANINNEEIILKDLEEIDSSVIKSISVTPGKFGTSKKIEMKDSLKAIEQISKLAKLIEDKPALDLNGANVNIYMPDNKRIKKEGEE